MNQIHKGTCFCGKVEIEVEGEPEGMGYCHCTSCRTWSAGPVNAFTLWAPENVRVTKGAEYVGHVSKTPNSDRQFCTHCGGHIMTHHPTLGVTDVYAALLPTVEFAPALHVNYDEAVLSIDDTLPKYRDFPAEFGGTGELVDAKVVHA